MIHAHHKILWQCLIKLNLYIPHVLAILLLNIYSRCENTFTHKDLNRNVHSSIIYNSNKPEMRTNGQTSFDTHKTQVYNSVKRNRTYFTVRWMEKHSGARPKIVAFMVARSVLFNRKSQKRQNYKYSSRSVVLGMGSGKCIEHKDRNFRNDETLLHLNFFYCFRISYMHRVCFDLTHIPILFPPVLLLFPNHYFLPIPHDAF